MSIAAIISIIIGAIGMIGGIIYNFYRTSKIVKENQLINVINLKNSDISKLERKITKFEDIIFSQEDMIRDLELSYIRLKSITIQYPFPFFLKDSQGTLIIVNEHWCKANNIRVEDALGKKDYTLFIKEEADIFKKTDDETQSATDGYMLFNDPKNSNNIVLKWRVPSIIKNEFYIAGISVNKQVYG